MKQQLNLTRKELRKLGFNRKVVTGETIYKMDVINGYFYYNEGDIQYKWYLKIKIGTNSNYIHLDIVTIPQLVLVLSSFRADVKF